MDFAFGHRIGRSHGASRCRQSSQLATVPTALFPRPSIWALGTPRYNRSLIAIGDR